MKRYGRDRFRTIVFEIKSSCQIFFLSVSAQGLKDTLANNGFPVKI